MKSFKTIIAIIGGAFLLLVFLSVLEGLKGSRLKQDISGTEEIIAEAQRAKKDIEEIQRQIDELKAASRRAEKMIPTDKQGVLELMEHITVLGNESGFHNIEFQYDVSKKSAGQEASTPDASRAKRDSDHSPTVRPLVIAMDFEAEFSDLISFLEEMTDLPTVVCVERVLIERSEEILPRQAASLELVTYLY